MFQDPNSQNSSDKTVCWIILTSLPGNRRFDFNFGTNPRSFNFMEFAKPYLGIEPTTKALQFRTGYKKGTKV